jgi:hypothetical protein
MIFVSLKSRDSSVSVETGLLAERGSIPSREREGFFLFATASRQALRPTQPPVQWEPEGSFPEGKEARA